MNPWDVPNIEVFAKTFYCCPECDLKEESNEEFIKHALQEHPNSREHIPKLLIKQEIITDPAFPNPHEVEDDGDYYFKDEEVENENDIDSASQYVSTELMEQEGDDQNDHNFANDDINLNNSSSHHECNFCRKVFSNPSGLKRHVKTVHEGQKQKLYKKKCARCGKMVFQMNRHLKSCTGDSPDKVYQCDFCLKTYLKISAYKIHMAKEHEDQKYFGHTDNFDNSNTISHHHEPEIKIKEEPKDNINTVKEEFQDEEKYSNLTENGNITGNGNSINSGDNQFDEKINMNYAGEYQCSYCDKKLTTKLDFKNHMTNVHEKLQCCQCDRKFVTHKILRCHVTTQHEGHKCEKCTPNVKCPECGKKYASSQVLKIHINTAHKMQRNYTCDLCGKSFARSGILKKHKSIVHEGKREYSCEHCGKKFSVRGNVTQHIKMVHEKQRNHICDSCGMAFCSAHSLRIHVNHIHLLIKYPCETCGKELSTKNELKEHENTVHKGLTNHQCRICGRKYSRKSHLRIHIKNSHPDIDPSDIHAAMIHLEKL